MKANPREILMRLRVASPVGDRCYFSAIVRDKQIENYHLNEEKETLLPYRKSITFVHDSEVAEIDLLPLYEYPLCRHVLHVTAYNKKKPFESSSEYEIVVEILKVQLEKGDRSFRVRFMSANLKHKTEFFGRMKTYLKVLVNDALIWCSAVDQKGNQCPDYNEEVAIPFDALEDVITVKVMDKDFKYDDLVGEATFYAYELLAMVGEPQSTGLTFEGKAAGIVNYQVLEGPKVL